LRERGSGALSWSEAAHQLRACARFDPRVLILDEATSSIDTETELLIRDAVERLMEGRTSLVVAHRFLTIQSVDKIIVMHKGEIARPARIRICSHSAALLAALSIAILSGLQTHVC